MDADGIESLSFRAVLTVANADGHYLEIHGSGGWGFEFLRACDETPCCARGLCDGESKEAAIGCAFLVAFLVGFPILVPLTATKRSTLAPIPFLDWPGGGNLLQRRAMRAAIFGRMGPSGSAPSVPTIGENMGGL
jgi:hypothetical protein